MKDETLEALGKLVVNDMSRDAVHIAVVPIVAGERLIPGDHVSLNEDKARLGGNTVGIVDPYLKLRSVQEGDRFWLFLYPGSITALKHVWSHPLFVESAPSDDPKKISQEWLDDFCLRKYGRKCDFDFQCKVNDFILGDRDQTVSDWDEQDKVYREDISLFWEHFYVLTGRRGPGTFIFRACCI